MELTTKRIGDLIPYENNPRSNDEAVAGVAESIKQCGYIAPIIVDENGVILAGHTRTKALMCLYGADYEVQIAIAPGLTEEQKRKFRILDNKTGEVAQWDFEKLAREMEGLDFDGFDFGFDIPEGLMDCTATDDDFEPELPEEPKSKRGQIWQCGNHRVMCGDSTSAEDVKRLTAGAKIDLFLTDPPYGVAYEGKTKEALKIENDKMDDRPFLDFLVKAFMAADVVMKPGCPFYIWHADLRGLVFRQALEEMGWKLRQTIVWAKNTMVLGHNDYQWKHEPCLYGWKEGAHYFTDDRTQTTVFEDAVPDYGKMKKAELVEILEAMTANSEEASTIIHEKKPAANSEHPTMKPVKLFARHIKNSSKPGDSVLDLFGGSGTTLATCEQLRRKSYTMEIDPKYCDVILERYTKLTGREPVLMEE